MQRKVYSATNTDQISAQYSTAVHLRTMIHRTPHSTHPHNFAKVVEVPNSHRNTLLQYLSAIRRRSLKFSSRIVQVVHLSFSPTRRYLSLFAVPVPSPARDVPPVNIVSKSVLAGRQTKNKALLLSYVCLLRARLHVYPPLLFEILQVCMS